MKTQTEIERRIHWLLCVALDARVAEASKRLPRLCRHNLQNPLDTRRQVHGENNPGYNRISVARGEAVTQTIGLCMLGSDNPEVWGGTICEDDIDAQKCPLFEPRLIKETVLLEFRETLRDPDKLRVEFPEVHGLIWALEDSSWVTDYSKLPWWKRLWFHFLRIQVEPVRQRSWDHLLPLAQEPKEE